jgi:hypothetical protein
MRINGMDLRPFSPSERRILVLLGLRYPGSVPMREIIEFLWPDPDEEPGDPENAVYQTMHRLRQKPELARMGWRVRKGYGLERMECRCSGPMQRYSKNLIFENY